MNANEISDKLSKVKAMKLPHMSYSKVKEYYGGLPGFEETEENIKIVDEYFAKFLDTKNDYVGNGCWLCGNKTVSLSWGLEHGVAYSDCCGLSYVHYHYPNDVCKDGKLFSRRLDVSLQYHPDGFEVNENQSK